jgi:sugar phosphate isomerase/epimerase
VHPSERVRQRLGLQILFDFSDVVDAIGFAADNLFRVLEINLGNISFGRQLSSVRERKRIRAAAQKRKVRLAIHAVDGPSFFIPSDRVRACSVAELKLTLDRAAAIGAENVVMHLGFDMNFGFDGRTRYTHQEFPDYYRAALQDSLAELKDHARGRARLCVENVGGFRYPPTLPILGRLLGGNLGLCLDLGHQNVIPPAKRKVELAFFRRHLRRVFHSHIHDNSGVRDEHSALGDGRIDFVPLFRMLAGTDALMVFEVRPRESALRSREYFEREIAPKL